MSARRNDARGVAARTKAAGRAGLGLPAALTLAAGLWVLACGRETPTDTGGPLLPSDAVTTFEVLLDAPQYLTSDTAFSGFDFVSDAAFTVIANQYGNTVDAHAMARFEIPTLIAAPDSSDVVRDDSTPHYVGGHILLQIDTTRSQGINPSEISVYRITEEWDPITAGWTLSVDSVAHKQSWSQPGATGGPLVGTAMWPQTMDSLGVATDSVLIPVDSETIALWSDTTTRARGVVVTMGTPGARLRTVDFALHVDARPTFRPDTVVTVTVRPTERTFIYNPQLPRAASNLRVGGVPSWRSFLRMKDGLDTLTLACPPVGSNCRVRLKDATITYAAVLLTPSVAPDGFLPEDSMRVGSSILLVSDRAPLERSPLGSAVGASRDVVLPSRFAAPAGGPPVEVGVTDFMRQLVADTLQSGVPPSPWLALLSTLEGTDLGVAEFLPGPRLRLVLTVAKELQLR